MTFEMPKFNVKAKADVTQADVLASQEKSKYLGAGNHDVKVDQIEAKGPASDPAWFKVRVSMAGLNDAKVNTTLLVPVSSLKYKGSKGPTLFPLVKLQQFFRAVGEDAGTDNIYALCDKYFAKGKLKGATLNLDIGYNALYAKFVGEDVFQLTNTNGTPWADTDGNIPVLASRDECKAYALANNLVFQEYSEILKYTPKITAGVTDDAEDNSTF
jgi:hypothetical protein